MGHRRLRGSAVVRRSWYGTIFMACADQLPSRSAPIVYAQAVCVNRSCTEDEKTAATRELSLRTRCRRISRPPSYVSAVCRRQICYGQNVLPKYRRGQVNVPESCSVQQPSTPFCKLSCRFLLTDDACNRCSCSMPKVACILPCLRWKNLEAGYTSGKEATATWENR
jgi:hypothetical protein